MSRLIVTNTILGAIPDTWIITRTSHSLYVDMSHVMDFDTSSSSDGF
jgi:hypothetical protein